MRAPRIVIGAALIATLALSACQFGSRPENFPPARGPEGARIALRVSGEQGDRLGELYAVDSVGVIMRNTQLTRIAWTKIDAIDILRVSRGYDVHPGERVDAPHRARLALVSRFPQGLHGALLARVLSASEQGALVEIR